MSAMPEYVPDNDVLIKLDLAHKALNRVNAEYIAEYERMCKELEDKHNPFIWTAQSVLYEAMGKAGLAGFSHEDMAKVMGCRSH